MNTKYIIRAINVAENALVKIDKMNKKYPDIYCDKLQKIGNTVITIWYHSYPKIYYTRSDSLYDAFKVELHGLNYAVEFNSDLISKYKHHEDNEYIYELTFIKGYHGGEGKGDGHPRPGIPYWRTPYPKYTSWSRPAIRTFSPYYRMKEQMNKKIKEIDEQKYEEYKKIITTVIKSISRIKI